MKRAQCNSTARGRRVWRPHTECDYEPLAVAAAAATEAALLDASASDAFVAAMRLSMSTSADVRFNLQMAQ